MLTAIGYCALAVAAIFAFVALIVAITPTDVPPSERGVWGCPDCRHVNFGGGSFCSRCGQTP